MSSGRTLLAESLQTALPGWAIVSDARVLDVVRREGACVLWTSKRSRVAVNGFDRLTDEITLWVLSGVDYSRLEDDLDASLLLVFSALEELPEFAWTEAERGVLADKFEGWRITVLCNYDIDNN